MVEVKVFIACEIDEETKEKIKKFIDIKVKGEKYNLNFFIDKTILGGLKIMIGDKCYDGSLSQKLKNLKNSVNK